ncbi:MAG: hypothetical protein Q9220_000748 [cf. Caloplaca sp. 1 TL-2023]
MEGIAYPEVVHGCLTSLYHELDTGTILLLEKAILHRKLRNYYDSLQIFDNFSSATAAKPVVILERTWTLIGQYRFSEARLVAIPGIAASRSEGRGIDSQGPLIVLRALIAGLDSLIDGSTQGCYASLQEIFQWLWVVPVTEMTDVQVSSGLDGRAPHQSWKILTRALKVWAINIYYYLPTLLNRPSAARRFRDIPVGPGDSPWSGISLLRRYLQKAGRLNEAFLLFDTEKSLFPSKTSEIEALETMRSSCLAPSIQPLIFMQGSVALKLAVLQAEEGNEDGYREELLSATAALSVPQDSESGSFLLRTEAWLARLELARSRGEGPDAEDWEAFANYASNVGDFRTETKALTEALETMINPNSEEAVDVLPENKDRLRERLDELYARLGSSFHRSGRRSQGRGNTIKH